MKLAVDYLNTCAVRFVLSNACYVTCVFCLLCRECAVLINSGIVLKVSYIK